MNLLQNPVFRGMTEEELQTFLGSPCVKKKQYSDRETILRTGDVTDKFGIVLSGSVNIESFDIWGNRSILSNIEKGHVFAETYAVLEQPLSVDAVSVGNTEVLFLCLKHAPHEIRDRLQANLLKVTARKNIVLSSRIFCTTPKGVRDRVLTYLSQESVRHDSYEFDIPFDRQGMADYLNLDRSALSKELGRMKKDGLLDYRKNHFILYEQD